MPEEQARTASTTLHAKILFSVEEAAAMLGVHRATVYDLLAKGHLPSGRGDRIQARGRAVGRCAQPRVRRWTAR